jgi:hypothetical protein
MLRFLHLVIETAICMMGPSSLKYTTSWSKNYTRSSTGKMGGQQRLPRVAKRGRSALHHAEQSEKISVPFPSLVRLVCAGLRLNRSRAFRSDPFGLR